MVRQRDGKEILGSVEFSISYEGNVVAVVRQMKVCNKSTWILNRVLTCYEKCVNIHFCLELT